VGFWASVSSVYLLVKLCCKRRAIRQSIAKTISDSTHVIQHWLARMWAGRKNYIRESFKYFPLPPPAPPPLLLLLLLLLATAIISAAPQCVRCWVVLRSHGWQQWCVCVSYWKALCPYTLDARLGLWVSLEHACTYVYKQPR